MRATFTRAGLKLKASDFMTADTRRLRGVPAKFHYCGDKVAELAGRYHRETEAYDRTVCTGKNSYGLAAPIKPHELGLVNHNARKVREQIMYEAELNGISRKDMARAISHYMLMCP